MLHWKRWRVSSRKNGLRIMFNISHAAEAYRLLDENPQQAVQIIFKYRS